MYTDGDGAATHGAGTAGRSGRRLSLRGWVAGAVALIGAAFLALGASRSGDVVEFDAVSDVVATRFNALSLATSDVVFDETRVNTYTLTVAPEDWEWLNENATLEQYVPATLEFQGRVYKDVAVRYKGFFGNLRFCFDQRGNRTCDKLPLKLKFSEYNESGRFFGLRRLNFHSMEKDTTKMRDALAYGFYRAAGVPAPRTAYARVVVNGELLGLFSVVEQIDEEFIRTSFPDAGEGTLYKEVWPEHLTLDPYAAAIVKGKRDDAEAMLRFAQALQSAGEDEFLDVLESWTDIETFLNYLAVDRLIDNWDGIVAWYCPAGRRCFNHNYYWYEEAFGDRVWLIPWDMDNVFQQPSPIRTYYGMPDWDGSSTCKPIPVFLGIPGRAPACDEFIRRLAHLMWDDYAAASRKLLAGPFATRAVHARIDALAEVIADAVAEDPNGPSVTEWRRAVEALKSNTVSVRDYIEAKVVDE